MRLKACLNGGRTRDAHPAVPVTPTEVAAAALGALAAGAEAVHVHPRGLDGLESLAALDVGGVVSAVRAACPRTPIGVSTGLWIAAGDPVRRYNLVREWSALPDHQRPDFASVNVSEPGFADLAYLLWWNSIGVEPGVWSIADVAELSTVDNVPPWTRVLVEVIDAPASAAVSVAGEILDRLDAAGVVGPRLLHGEGDACWPLVAEAGRRGLPTRIGLEDTLIAPDGRPAQDNSELVRQALALWNAERANPR
jgi:uncharacterized protein (DUF849 family)